MLLMEIKKIIPRMILDSRGNPTVEADVWTESGIFGRAAVPSGASTGLHEAHELRDGGEVYDGMGVKLAIAAIEQELTPLLLGKDVRDQQAIDQAMITCDGSPNKSRLGANAILAVSLAVAHAAAKAKQQLLYVHINELAGKPAMRMPMPMMNVLNGGKHALGSSDFQEFMLVPRQASTYDEAVRIGVEIFQKLKKQLQEKQQSTAVGDEGGFTYPVDNNSDMLQLLLEATQAAGYKIGSDVGFALDVAATELYNKDSETYFLAREDRTLSAEDMISYLRDLCSKYPIISIEDGLAEDAWNDWSRLTRELHDVQIVGDDLLVTNLERLERAIAQQSANAILIKPNQIGTLSETIQVINRAKEAGWRTIVSHRSGETEDTTIVHIAIGTGAGQLKTGSLSRTDRTAKHNECMRLESIDENLQMSRPF